MVDWVIARQVARFAAGTVEPVGDDLDLTALCSEMERHVAAYTGLSPVTPVPPPEAVTRTEWTAVNLDALSRLLDPVAERLDTRLDFAGPLAGALRHDLGELHCHAHPDTPTHVRAMVVGEHMMVQVDDACCEAFVRRLEACLAGELA